MAIDKLETMERIRARSREAKAAAEKGVTSRAIGWVCIYVPEELIHSAGALPVRIIGDPELQALDKSNVYLSANICSFVRNCYEQALQGDYRFLSGIILARMCDGIRRLGDVWKAYQKPPLIHVLEVPRKRDSTSEAYFLEELRALKQKLERELQVDISTQVLQRSIGIYNEGRQLFGQLQDLMKRERPPLYGSELLEIANAGWFLPREEFNLLLGELMDEVTSSRRAISGKARLMLSGSILANPKFVEQIEHLGGIVVVNELCTGGRYWLGAVDSTAEPLSALAHRYLNLVPCARMIPSEDRASEIVELAREYAVNGVVSQVIHYCVPYIHDQVTLKRCLEEEKVPVLALDLEYGAGASGQLATRIEAFIEMLQESKLPI